MTDWAVDTLRLVVGWLVWAVVAGVLAGVGAYFQALREGKGTASFWEWARTLFVWIFVVGAAVWLVMHGVGFYFSVRDGVTEG